MNKSNPKCLLYVITWLYSIGSYAQIGSNGNFSDFMKVHPWSDRSNGIIAQSDNSHPSYVSLHNENTNYGTWEIKAPLLTGSNYSIAFRHSSTSNPLFDVLNNGRVGLGTSTPSRFLHLRNGAPNIFLDLSSSGFAKLELGSTNSVYEMSYASIPAAGNGQLKIGPVNTAYKSVYYRNFGGANSFIVFSNNYLFGDNVSLTGYPGLSGTYLFDDQVSATKLMVAAATVSPYPAIPSGYLFNVQGDSYLKGKTYQDGLLQISNATDLDPDKAISGITMGNSINTITANPPSVLGEVPYSWLQSQESRPLALNPIPNANPGVTNTSYVAIGFVPGNYNVPVGYKLAVKGKIICEELKVKFAGQWSDYVFENDYKLRNLNEVKHYIAEHKHLPDVPSEAEIKAEGIEAGQMDATLLKKIEELTLYMIAQNEKMEEMKGVINQMDIKIKELEAKDRTSR